MIYYLFTFILFFFPLLGEENPVTDPFQIPELVKTEEESGHFFGQFLYMLLMLGILISLLYFLSWFLKRMMNTRADQLNANSTMKIIERRTLSQRTTLFLVEYEGEEILFAETPTTVVPLSKSKVD